MDPFDLSSSLGTSQDVADFFYVPSPLESSGDDDGTAFFGESAVHRAVECERMTARQLIASKESSVPAVKSVSQSVPHVPSPDVLHAELEVAYKRKQQIVVAFEDHIARVQQRMDQPRPCFVQPRVCDPGSLLERLGPDLIGIVLSMLVCSRGSSVLALRHTSMTLYRYTFAPVAERIVEGVYAQFLVRRKEGLAAELIKLRSEEAQASRQFKIAHLKRRLAEKKAELATMQEDEERKRRDTTTKNVMRQRWRPPVEDNDGQDDNGR